MLLVLLLVMLLEPFLLAQGWLLPIRQPLALHITWEVFALCVAALIFATGWSAPQSSAPGSVQLLAAGFLGVALLDFSHMMSFAGMPHYFGPAGPEKAINFWLAARFLAALLLLWVALRPWGAALAVGRNTLLGLLLLVVAAVHFVFLSRPDWLPRTFIDGQGLTPIKIAAEWVIIVIATAAAWLYVRDLRVTKHKPSTWLAAAALITAASEIFFTLYTAVDDIYNLTGHVYKILAYACLYVGLVQQAIRAPYERLEQTREQQQALLDLYQHAEQSDEAAIAHRAIEHAQRLSQEPAQWQFESGGVPQRLVALSTAQSPLQPETLETLDLIGVTARQLIQHKRDTQAVRNSEQRLSDILDQIPALIFIKDRECRYRFVNRSVEVLLNKHKADIIGQDVFWLWDTPTAETLRSSELRVLEEGRPLSMEVSLTLANQETARLFWAVLAPLRDAQSQVIGLCTVYTDITEQAEVREQIQRLSLYDQLTGLPNRTLLQQFVEPLLGADHDSVVGILFIDVDHFKSINDSLGHRAGDILLQGLASRLQHAAPAGSLLARPSGDEFVLAVPNLDEGEAARLALRILRALGSAFVVEGREIHLTASVGIAVSPKDSKSFEGLLRAADTAMHQVKNEGRSHYRFFAANMEQQAARHFALNTALSGALNRGEFRLVFQPQVSLHNESLVGVEALLRWNHPELGQVSPAEFIPVAEDTGLIVPIGEWVLHEALAQLKTWRSQGLQVPLVAVNLSAVQFRQSDLVDRVMGILRQHQIPAHSLELELTEAVAMRDPEGAARTMQQLHELGVRMSIDDFGTGYSSLSYLQRFRVYKLKIDQSFVRRLLSSSSDEALVRAIVQMGESLALQTIAEGVETPEQASILATIGCDQLQGYLISPPLSPEDFAVWLQQRH